MFSELRLKKYWTSKARRESVFEVPTWTEPIEWAGDGSKEPAAGSILSDEGTLAISSVSESGPIPLKSISSPDGLASRVLAPRAAPRLAGLRVRGAG